MLARPQLEQRLDGAFAHRLTTVVAAAGYGKSTVLESWADGACGVLHRVSRGDRELTRFAGTIVSKLRLRVPDVPIELALAADGPLGPDAHVDEAARAAALAGALSAAVAMHLTRDLVLVLDDVDVIADAAGPMRFVENLVREGPRRLHVVTASRQPLPFPTDRLRREHQVLDLDATDLVLSVDEVARLAEHELGDAGQRIAAALHRASGGWPAAARAALDRLARSDPAMWAEHAATIAASSEPLERLTLGAFQDLPEPTRQLLRAALVVPVLNDRLAAALDAPTGTLSGLAARGLFLEHDEDGFRLSAMSRQVLATHAPLPADVAGNLAASAAQWYVAHGHPELALRAAITGGSDELVVSLLARHGSRLVEHPDDVLAAVDRLPAVLRALPDVMRLAATAHHNRGAWNEARDLFGRVANGPAFDAEVAWRLGFIAHLRGELESALASYRRGAEYGKPEADAVMCAAMVATVRWLQGDRDACADAADAAHEQAVALGDPRTLAATHTVLAMLAALDGNRRANDAHYLRALEHAERAGDIVQQIRIRCNRASHHLEEGAYQDALAELDIAGRLSDMTGFTPFAALTLSNRAETLLRLGRLEEAELDAADATAWWQAQGSRLVGYGLIQLAQIQALRGDVRSAVAGYRAAIEQADRAGELQGLVPALVGLAQLLLVDDPAEATRLADWALEHGEAMAAVAVRVAAARVAIATGRRLDARHYLDEAAVIAAERRDGAGAAAVVELRAVLDADPALADEAVARWRKVGDPIGLARAEVARASFSDAQTARETAHAVRFAMQAIGCRSLDGDLDALVARSSPSTGHRLRVETLGSFRVLRGGQPVARTAWQSRKARDLLKILVARRGRPTARNHVAQILWPDVDDEATSRKRLNVMVSTLRAVLDPGHDLPPTHAVVSEEGTLRLDLDNVDVDVERFLGLVTTATRLDQAGRRSDAITSWRRAESAYTGDFCEEEPYADWAVMLREQARHGYVQAAARVATAESEDGRPEQAARFWLRLLERDRYDEHAHLGLIRAFHAAGRHGDAHRRYRLYADRMGELGLEPAPMPS